MPNTNVASLKDIDIPRFIEEILKFEGQPYCWPDASNNYSGKGTPTATYKDCHDCSGVVTDGLYRSTSGKIDIRSTVNAQGLYGATSRVDSPQTGDLCFYGHGPSSVSHVMVFVSGRCFGASGGNHLTTTPKIAKQMNASVRYESNVHYRPDFVAYGRFQITNNNKE